MEKLINKIKEVPFYWAISIVLIYALLLSEYVYFLNSKLNLFQANTESLKYVKLFNNFTFFLVFISVFVIWLMSSMLFHLFSILIGGDLTYKTFLKSSVFSYIAPAICFLISIIIINGIKIPTENVQHFLETDKTISTVNLIINISYVIYFIVLLFIIKYLYKVNWVKALAVIVVPIGSIYVLAQVFGKYIL